MRKFAVIVCIVLVAYGVATVGLYAAMRQTPETFGAVMAKLPMISMAILPFEPLWMSARSGKLNAGDAAPDFTLPRINSSGASPADGPVSLSSELRQKPVALIFGSYT